MATKGEAANRSALAGRWFPARPTAPAPVGGSWWIGASRAEWATVAARERERIERSRLARKLSAEGVGLKVSDE